MFRNTFFIRLSAFLLVFFLGAEVAGAARIKDLTNVVGVRDNKLIGFGLVVGLDNTGDRATNVFFSIQTMFLSIFLDWTSVIFTSFISKT